MRRAPAKPVRACTLRKWCLSHVTFEAPLRTSHFSLQSSHSTLHTSHSTLHTEHPITTHTHTQAHPKQLEATVTMRQKKRKATAAAPAAQTRYLSSPAAATLHGKTQGFVLRLPPQHKAHATFMQPLHSVSQHHVANLHVYTHMAIPDDNSHAAIPMRSATKDSKTPFNYAHTSTPKAA